MKTTMVEELPVKLDPHEKQLKGEQLSQAVNTVHELEEKKKSVTSDFAQKIKDANHKVYLLAQEVRTGEELRPVECYEQPRYSELLVDVIRQDTGACVRTRPMHPTERQQAMGFGESTAGRRRGRGQLDLAKTPTDDEPPEDTH